jgi:hypothetical protein
MRNQVFISYRNESTVHAAAVRRLGQLLVQAKLPVELDQFYLDKNPGGPNLGWPKWCEDAANESQCVLIVGSEGWFTAYDKTANPGSGFGAASEADLFRQGLYDNKGQNDRIRLAFLHTVAPDLVPVRLRAWHQFRPFDAAEELEQMIRWIADCLGLRNVQLPGVVWPPPVAFQADLANRNKKEWPAIVDLLTGQSKERILLIEGGSGVGKSELIRQAKAYARKLDMMVAHIDLKGGVSRIEDLLGTLSLGLEEQLPNFSREGASKTYLLRKDLRTMRQPLLLIFDTYEGAVNSAVADWLGQQLLPEVETSLGLAVIVAGQKVPDYSNSSWRELARHLVLEPITEYEAWHDWVSRRYPGFQDKADLRTLIKVSDGSPLLMSTFCAKAAKD